MLRKILVTHNVICRRRRQIIVAFVCAFYSKHQEMLQYVTNAPEGPL